MTYIYALCDPETGKPRYVGKSNDPPARYRTHLHDKRTSEKAKWINGLSAIGKKPLLVIYAEVRDEAWRRAEHLLIAGLREMGYDLINDDPGGTGPGSLSQLACAKVTAALIGNQYTLGYHASEETRQKMHKPHGPMSARTKTRMSLANRGMNNNSHNAKLTDDKVRAIREMYSAGGISQRRVGKLFGVEQTVISAIVRHKTWRHVQ